MKIDIPTLINYNDAKEIVSPTQPASGYVRFYGKINPDTGFSALYYMDDSGTEFLAGGTGGGGATSFIDLNDVPNSYLGAGSKIVAVKSDASGLEFITSPNLVTSVFGRTGDVALQSSDVTTALTYTPEDVANKNTTITLGSSNTLYPSQLAVKTYVDNQIGSVVSGQIPKQSCRVATVTAGTLATDFENGDTVDTVTLATNDRILIKNQASAVENGIYTVNASGAPTRATDYDTSAEVAAGTFTFITSGSQANTEWIQITQNPTLGVSNLVFTQVGAVTAYTASLGVKKVTNDFEADILANNGLKLTGNSMSVAYDNSSIGIVSNLLAVKASGITNTMLAGSIADSKLLQITTASKVSGAAITLLSSVPSGAGILPTTNLGSGSPTSSNYLRGDGSWQPVTGSGSGNGTTVINYSKALETTTSTATISNSAVETTIYTSTLTGGTLGTSGNLRLRVAGTYLNDSTASRTVTIKLKYGTTTLISTTSAAIANSATVGTFYLEFDMNAVGSASSQFATLSGVFENGAGTKVQVSDNGVSTENSATNLALTVTITLSANTATQTFTKNYSLLSLLNATDNVGTNQANVLAIACLRA